MVDRDDFDNNFRRALNKGLRIVARREVCRYMIIDHLRDEFGGEIAESAADEIVRLGLVDDSRYARLYAHQLFDKGFYIRRVVYELRGKGVDSSLARETAANLAPDQEEAITQLINGRLRVDLSDSKSIRRVMSTLDRYGYDGEVVRKLISNSK